MMEWKGSLFVDTCLPFGLRSAPRLFNILANLAAWVMQQQGVSCLMHYLDDFLTIGPSGLDTCQRNLNIITSVCATLGIPLASGKVEGPSTALTFLDIILDTETMEAPLPEEKINYRGPSRWSAIGWSKRMSQNRKFFCLLVYCNMLPELCY